jgi:hypothetical protein
MPASPDNELTRFLTRHGACPPVFDWLARAAPPITTLGEAWDRCPEPGWLLWALDRAGYDWEPGAKAYRYLSACLKEVENSLTDADGKAALAVLHDHGGNGGVPPERLAAARCDAERAADASRKADGADRPLSHTSRAALALAAALGHDGADRLNAVDYAAGLAAEAASCDPRDGKIDWQNWTERRRRQADRVRGLVTAEQRERLLGAAATP